jgi:hypothetical protein
MEDLRAANQGEMAATARSADVIAMRRQSHRYVVTGEGVTATFRIPILRRTARSIGSSRLTKQD